MTNVFDDEGSKGRRSYLITALLYAIRPIKDLHTPPDLLRLFIIRDVTPCDVLL